jgi:four helix bundle protein
MPENELTERLFYFSVNVIKFLKELPKNPENSVVRYQLAKSSTSSGANYEEAQAGSSKADFSNKVRISLREMRESNYWLRLIKAANLAENIEDLDLLIKESNELKNILGAIIQRCRKA